MDKLTVRDIPVTGKRVLVRVDFNVPMDKQGFITDDSRIRAALPTITYLIDYGAKVILISHLGRPDGKVVPDLRLTPIAQRLSQLLGQQVGMATNCIGPEVEKSVATLKNGDVLMLENLRFHDDEETGSEEFAAKLARLGDVFVNDAFGTSHRAHASISVIAKFLPAVAGFLLENEINTLGSLLKNPAYPFTSLLGGAKVSDKTAMLHNIMSKVNCFLIGGGMSVTFLKAKGLDVGASNFEKDSVQTAADIMKKAAANNVKVVLPVDVIVADKISNDANVQTVPVEFIPKDMKVVDIGPGTIQLFEEQLRASKTVFWNGTMGINEIHLFANGTRAMALTLANLKATTIIGGGSTAEVFDSMALVDRITFVSTGGGASLLFLSGEKLPGVEALLDKVPARK